MVYPEYLFKNKFQERILLCKTAFLTIFRHITLLFGQCQFEHFWLPSQLCRTLDGLPFRRQGCQTVRASSNRWVCPIRTLPASPIRILHVCPIPMQVNGWHSSRLISPSFVCRQNIFGPQPMAFTWNPEFQPVVLGLHCQLPFDSLVPGRGRF